MPSQQVPSLLLSSGRLWPSHYPFLLILRWPWRANFRRYQVPHQCSQGWAILRLQQTFKSWKTKHVFTRFIHRYTACRSDLVSPLALLWITRSKKAVRRAVFSIRFVVASMRENTFASAAYGTLSQRPQIRWTWKMEVSRPRIAHFPSSFDINFTCPG